MSTDKILECDHLKLMTATKQYICVLSCQAVYYAGTSYSKCG